MQTENKSNTHWEKTVKASDFFRALLSIASSVTAEMQNIKIITDGDTFTALIDDACITIAPVVGSRYAAASMEQEGGAA